MTGDRAPEAARQRASPAPLEAPGGADGSRVVEYGQALLEALAGEMARDPRVILLGPGDLELLPRLSAPLTERFGEGRVRRVAGPGPELLAKALDAAGRGLRPCVEIPLVAPCCSSWAGALGRGPDGRLPPLLLLHTVRAAELFCARPLLRAFPDVRVVAASGPFAAQGLVRAVLRGDEPVLVLSHQELLEARGEVPEGDYVVSPAGARLLRNGKDATLVAHHRGLRHGLVAAAELAKEGVSVEVLDPVSLSPVDEETLLASARRTGRLVIVEEPETAGLAAELAAVVCEEAFFDLDAPVKRVGHRASRDGREGGGAPAGPPEIRAAIASIL